MGFPALMSDILHLYLACDFDNLKVAASMCYEVIYYMFIYR